MANKDYNKVQTLADNELSERLSEVQLELTTTRFDQAITGNVSINDLRNNRKEIARIQTEIRSRELAKLSEADLAKRSKIRHRRRK